MVTILVMERVHFSLEIIIIVIVTCKRVMVVVVVQIRRSGWFINFGIFIGGIWLTFDRRRMDT